MDVADTLVKNIFTWLDLLKEGAEKMNRLASELEEHNKNVNISQVVGSAVSAGGLVAMIGGRILALCKPKAAAPLLAVADAGAVAGVLGAATSVGSTAVEAIISSKSMKEAEKIGEDIENVVKEIKKHIDTLSNKWQKSRTQDDLCFDSPEDYVVEQILRAMAKDFGLQINGRIKLSNMLLDSGRCLRLLSQLVVETISKASLSLAKDTGKTAAVAVTKTIGYGSVGLVFSVPDLIINSISLAKNNSVTEASQSLRKAVAIMLDSSEQMRNELDSSRELLQELNDLKNNIENQKRNDSEKKSLMWYAIKHCRNEAARRWLSENLESESFSKLVDVFFFLLKQIDEEEKNHSNKVDIIFVAHGSIEDQMIPASCLLPLDSIHDVVLYSPWNCVLNADAAYGIATGIMEPQERDFYCSSEDCKIPKEKHQPTKLPNEWNSMKKAGDEKIPNIMLSPLRIPEDGAWKCFEVLKGEYGPPGNRILIPFIIPEGTKFKIPFSVVSLALSLVLMFSRFQATLHLTACLGKGRQEMKLYEYALKKQYAYTIDNTGMTSLAERFRMNEELYTKLQTVFGERSSGC